MSKEENRSQKTEERPLGLNYVPLLGQQQTPPASSRSRKSCSSILREYRDFLAYNGNYEGDISMFKPGLQRYPNQFRNTTFGTQFNSSQTLDSDEVSSRPDVPSIDIRSTDADEPDTEDDDDDRQHQYQKQQQHYHNYNPNQYRYELNQQDPIPSQRSWRKPLEEGIEENAEEEVEEDHSPANRPFSLFTLDEDTNRTEQDRLVISSNTSDIYPDLSLNSLSNMWTSYVLPYQLLLIQYLTAKWNAGMQRYSYLIYFYYCYQVLHKLSSCLWKMFLYALNRINNSSLLLLRGRAMMRSTARSILWTITLAKCDDLLYFFLILLCIPFLLAIAICGFFLSATSILKDKVLKHCINYLRNNIMLQYNNDMTMDHQFQQQQQQQQQQKQLQQKQF